MKKLLPKIIDAMKETFVGDYVFTADELSCLYEFTSRLLHKYNGDYGVSITKECDPVIFVALANAIKMWNPNEEKFWDCIYRQVSGGINSKKIYDYFTGVIDRLGRQRKILYLSGCQKRYYATVLAHAYAPTNSTESFLELCWELYSKDMNFTYTKNDDIFELVAEELKCRFSNDQSLDDDFKLGSGVYFLRAGIKQMAVDAPEEMVKLIEKTVYLLDRAFEGELFDNTQYYNSILYKWWEEKEKSFGVEKPKRKHYERAITDYSAIRPKYSYDGKQVILTIPSIRLKNNFYDTPILNFYRNGELVDQREMNTFGSGLTKATKEMYLHINEIVTENEDIDFTLEIVHSDEVFYNSKKSLFREFILFRNHREIFQEECQPGNYILFAPKFEMFSTYPEEIKNIYGESSLYNIHSREGEMLQNPKRTVFFVLEKQKNNIRIVANKKNNAKFIHGGEEYSVIDGDLKVVVKSDVDITKYGVRYESHNFRLRDFTCFENEEYKTFLITELLNVCEPQKINIFNYADNKIEAMYNVVKFNNINITYDKKLYFDRENTGVVRFHTEKYDKSVSFNIDQENICIPFDDGDIVLFPPVLRWKFGSENFTTQYGDHLWYKNYTNSTELVVDLPVELGYQVILSNNSMLTESVTFNSFKLGETVWSMLRDNKTEITVFVKVEEVGIFPILTICLKERFKSSPLEVKNGEIVWNAKDSFIGERPASFTITVYKGEAIKCRYEIKEDSTENYQVKNLSLPALGLGTYKVIVDLLKIQAFKKMPQQIYEQTFKNGSGMTIEWLSKKIEKMRISKVVLYDGSEKLQSTFFVNNFKFVEEKDEKPVFEVSMYRLCSFGDKKIDKQAGYCMILSENECVFSCDKNFNVDFFWQAGKMISSNSKDGQRIKKYIFVK